MGGGPLAVEDRTGGVRLVRMDDPATRNALSEQMLAALVGALAAADEDPAIGCVVLAGADRVFASGADIGMLAEASAEEIYLGRRPRQWDAIRATRTPTVAAVSGACLGGGLELALGCDMVVCSSRSKFGLPETGLGLIPGAGGTQLLTRAVGKSLAVDMVLSGRLLDGREAEAAGLVSRALPEGPWLEEAIAIAAEIAARPALAQILARDSVRMAQETPLDAGIEAERRAFAMALASEEAREGLNAFLEKRPPSWRP